jgi:structural maintenance of chromosome 4
VSRTQLIPFFFLFHRSSDDDEDDDDDEDNGTEQQADAKEPTAPTDEVKAEDPDQGPKRTKAPSSELHIYSADELSKFKKRDMTTDVELLDGLSRQ